MEQNFYARFDNFTSGKYCAWLFSILFFITGIVLTFSANGTCDDGDSIMHYQFARWAVKHHELFFDHWAKPLYVLIACPFAQFGLPGIKIFNLALGSTAIVLTFCIAEKLNAKRAGLTALMMAMSPGLITHSLSGLTEPLFAAMLTGAILLYLQKREMLSVVVISFLPFVRSEGLIICGVFGLMLAAEMRWRLIPLLFLGHLVYGIAGYHKFGTFLWVFTKIPYAHASGLYGKGHWRDFFVNLPTIIGVPLCILLLCGLISRTNKLCQLARGKSEGKRWTLVYGSFAAYFLGHVIFWKFGIFNSLGLLRVMVGVLPMMAIIELEGLNALTACLSNPTIRGWVTYVLLAAVLIFPFTSSSSAWHYNRDFCLSTSQLADKSATDYIKNNFNGFEHAKYYYDANYVSIQMNIDYFDTAVSCRVWEAYEHPPSGDAFIIWDNYYSEFEFQTKLEVPVNNPRFALVKKFALRDPWNYEKATILFKAKPE